MTAKESKHFSSKHQSKCWECEWAAEQISGETGLPTRKIYEITKKI